VNEITSVTVFDTCFSPKEYLVDAIKNNLKTFISQIISFKVKDESILLRPSLLLSKVNAYCSVLKSVENYIDIDVCALINSVLLDEISTESSGENNEPTCIAVIAQFYSNLISKKMEYEKQHYIKPDNTLFIYDSNEKAFINRGDQSIRIDLYCSLTELKNLCLLVGPYGINKIDREMLKWIKKNVSELHGILKIFKEDFLTFKQGNLLDENFVSNSLNTFRKRIVDFDLFLTKSISIGNTLHFRKLLFEALQEVTSENIPLIYTGIRTAYEQYPPNLFMHEKLVEMDSLALNCGITLSIDDPELHKVLVECASVDSEIWDLLPIMYAVSMGVSNYWRDAIYNPVIRGYENNVHVLITTINTLIIGFKAMALGPTARDTTSITQSLNTFVTITAMLLLKMLLKQIDKPPKDLPSVVIFLDMFIEECPLIDRNIIDSIIPSSIFQAMWREVYAFNPVERLRILV